MPKANCPRCKKTSVFAHNKLGGVVSCPYEGCGKQFRLRASSGGPARGPKLAVAHSPAAHPDFRPGDLFDGRFEIDPDWEPRRGSFGAVYRAFDIAEQRDVALKVPHDSIQFDEHYMERFATEVDSLQVMVHPNIVRFFEAHLESRPAYLVTEFVDGSNLDSAFIEARKAGGMDRERVVRIVIKVARALQHAHNKQVVHRDVKPSNILLVGDEVKLTDFGLARFGDPRLTQHGARIGTPFYMAPEQVEGDPARVGPASDQYGLGVVLYQLLCGRVPFEAASAEAVYPKIREGRVPRLSVLEPSIPPELESICLRALAKSSDDRWEDCATFARQLETVLRSGCSTPSPEIEAASDPGATHYEGADNSRKGPGAALESEIPDIQTVRPPVTNASAAPSRDPLSPVIRIAAVGAMILRPLALKLLESVCLVLALARIHVPGWLERTTQTLSEWVETSINEKIRDRLPNEPEDDESDEEWESEEVSDPSVQAASVGPISLAGSIAPSATRSSSSSPAIASTSDASVQGYLHQLEKSHACWRDHDQAEARVQLSRCPIHQQGWEWSYLRALTHSNFRRFAGAPRDISALACAPRGQAVAAIAGEEMILWKASSKPRRVKLGNHAGRAGTVAFSGDGRFVVTGNSYVVRIWDAETGKEIRSLRSEATVRRVTFTPDGTHVAVACGDGAVRIWAIPGGGDPTILNNGSNVIHALAMHGDGRRLVVGGGDGTLRLWDWREARELARASAGSGSISEVAFHPDGRSLVTAGRNRDLKFWGAERLEPLAQVQAHEGEIAGVAYHPVGRWIASMGADRVLRIGEAVHESRDATSLGRLALNVPMAGSTVGAMAFAADGQRLILAGDGDRMIRSWSPPAFWAALAVDVRPDMARAIALHPDGRSFAIAGLDGSVTIRDITPGLASTPFEKSPSSPRVLAFQPDGLALVAGCEDGVVRRWDTVEGRLLPGEIEAHDKRIIGLAYRADGQRFATTGADGTIKLWETQTNQLVREFAVHAPRGVNPVAFLPGPDFGLVTGGGMDHSVRIWDENRDEPIVELHGHERPVMAVAVSRDGRRVTSVGLDRTLRIWSIPDGSPLLVLEGVDVLPSVADTSTQTTLAAVGEDHFLIVEGRSDASRAR